MRKNKTPPRDGTQMGMQVVRHVRELLERGALRPGDKLPPERELARKLKISRASLRAGIGSLAAMGVLTVRHGVGNFIAEGPPAIGGASIGLLGVLHGFQLWQMFETRVILECNLAALAAERGSDEDFQAMAGEVASIRNAVDRPSDYLDHDFRFHRLIAQASGNPILAALMETITTSLQEERRKTVEQASDLRESAEMHERIYRAIRERNPVAARDAMERHLKLAEAAQLGEREGVVQSSAGRPRAKKPAGAVP